MVIYIKKKSGGFAFIKDDQLIYWGVDATKRLKLSKQLYANDILIAEVNLKIKFPFNISYILNFTQTNEVVDLKLVSKYLKAKYVCYHKNDTYEVILHFGHNTSVFKNGNQIAYFTLKEVEFFGGQTIYLVANWDVNLELLLSMVLALKCDFNNDYSTMTVDIGNLAPGERPFDKTWRPT